MSPVAVQNLLLSAFSARLNRERHGGRYAEFRELLEQSQWWDRARMRAWQEERLRLSVLAEDQRELDRHYGPFSHAVRALCLWRSQDPYQVWRQSSFGRAALEETQARAVTNR